MTKEEILVSVLKTATSKNVYAIEKPNGDNDCVTFRQISSLPYKSHSGFTGLKRERYLITCYGKSYSDAKTLSDLVFGCLDGNTTSFKIAICVNEDEVKDIAVNLYKVNSEYFII